MAENARGQEIDRNKSHPTLSDSAKRKAFLKGLLAVYSEDYSDDSSSNHQPPNGRVSFKDKTFQDWLKRTGDLPPDFDKMPSIPYLPNPLIIDEGRKNIPVTTMRQWKEKRAWMKKELEYYITGTMPPPPENLISKVLSERKEGEITIRTVELLFGPGRRAKMTLQLMIPPGKGPFPVFMTQWVRKDWAGIAVGRGYIGCIYAGCHGKDDTKNYGEIWGGKYDWSRFMKRVYGASRVIDYLYTLPIVNKKQIALTGHSRNGKQSLWVAAFDNRITAVIPSSGGTGAEVPWRYARHKYGCEDIALESAANPSWFVPRLDFFIGRENKLPVDQNFFLALVAPRGLMISSSRREDDSNPWGLEQEYDSVKKVYEFLGEPNHFAIRLRDGLHGVKASDIEDYIDFFDYIFGRPGGNKPADKLFYNYSFKKWRALSYEEINPLDYPIKNSDDLLVNSKGENITSVKEWRNKKKNIKQAINWGLGNAPFKVINPGPRNFQGCIGKGEAYFGNFRPRPKLTDQMGMVPVGTDFGKPSFGNYLYSDLYYPKVDENRMKNGTIKLPVIIYLHEYDYSEGFWDNQHFDHSLTPFLHSLVKQGYAVLFYDMMGFGNRIEEGTRFFQRYPHWSKMGKFVADLKAAVTAVSNLNFIDSSNITVMGYSLGATVGLYGAALDPRISRVVSVCGFTPMRTDTPDKGTEGIKGYSYLRGLLPRLGFFVGHENRIPYDYDDILASIAPRPLLVIAPVWDEDATLKDVQTCVKQVGKVYQLYGQPDNIQTFSPFDFNRFSPVMQERVLKWLSDTNTNPAKVPFALSGEK